MKKRTKAEMREYMKRYREANKPDLSKEPSACSRLTNSDNSLGLQCNTPILVTGQPRCYKKPPKNWDNPCNYYKKTGSRLIIETSKFLSEQGKANIEKLGYLIQN